MIAAANLLAYCAQITLLILLCAGLPRLIRLSSPVTQHAFWRLLLVTCLALPVLQPWRTQFASLTARLVPAASAAGAGASTLSFSSTAVTVPFDIIAVGEIVLMAGIACRLAWIALGLVRLRQMRRRAREQAAGFDDLKEAIGSRPEIRWSSDVRHPVTFGVLDPVVLLPIALKAVDRGAQRAVVAHELHHVHRRDWAWVMAEEIVRSVFWFHPAMWWLVSRVQLARETVVDELSILVTNARRTYLDALLAFADDSGLTSSAAFSARRHLFHRVMLLSKENQMSSIRVALGSCLLVAALGAGTWSVVQAFPLHAVVVVASAGDAAATPTAVLPAAPSPAPAGLQDQQPPPPPPPPTRPVDPKRTMPPPPPPPPPKPPVMPAAFKQALEDLKPIRLVPGSKTNPVLIYEVKPKYPPDVQADKLEGTVTVDAIVDTTGAVYEAMVVQSIPAFDQAALDAVKQWRFQPGLLNGEPVAVVCTIEFTFTVK
jgi:TonB family protein